MSRRAGGFGCAALGAIAALVAIFAQPLGLGNAPFGWKQINLLVVGIVVIGVGVTIVLRSGQGH